MYCGYCGEQIRDDVTFCPKCGGPVSQIAADELDEDEEEFDNGAYYPPTKAEKKRHPVRIAVLIVLVLVIAAIAVAAALKLTGNNSGDEVVQGQSSVTSLVNSYLFAAEDRNLDSMTALYFPGSEGLYNSGSEEELPAADLLAQEDAWTGYYGKEVSEINIGTSDFADLNSSKAASVAQLIQECSGVDSISELFTVPVDVTYADGNTVTMTFEIVQTDLGTYLVEVD